VSSPPNEALLARFDFAVDRVWAKKEGGRSAALWVNGRELAV